VSAEGFRLPAPGEIVAIVGPSGAGKSTLARRIARDNPGTQLIFQQPAESLNPRFTAAEIVAEPLVIRRGGPSSRYTAEVHRWMEFVGLSPRDDGKPAHEFSGGERQRLAIARAFAAGPELLILDESLSGLHASLQQQIADLLRGHTCILISHDLALVARLASRIFVMDGGAIVEQGDTAELMARPQHPRTRELLAASAALEGV
jgi:peptide/nickel transport system ATP-binding protein